MSPAERARDIVIGADVHGNPCDCQYVSKDSDCEKAREWLVTQIAAALAAQAAQTEDVIEARRLLAANFGNRGEEHTQLLADIARVALRSHKEWFEASEKASADAKRAWRDYRDMKAKYEAEAAQTRTLRDAAELVLNSERDDDGEGSWYCVLASDMAALRAALTGAPREPRA